MDSAGGRPEHAEIELRAYALWQERGTPIGTPEVDWFRAEDELKTRRTDPEPALAAIARTIGSALGSVAALVSD
jgi:hypothetical protein